MRDPHIIIGAFIEKRRRDDKQDFELHAFHNSTGGWVAHVSHSRAQGMPIAYGFGVSLDAALQNLAKEVDTDKHVVVQP